MLERLEELLLREDLSGEVRETLLELAAAWRSSEAGRERAREVLDNIIDLNPYAMALFDWEGHCTRVNQAFQRLFGGVPPSFYTVFDDPILQRHELQEAVREIRNGATFECPELWYDPSEAAPEEPSVLVCIHFIFFPVHGPGGEVEQYVGMYEDITKRRRAEDAGVSHLTR